MYENISNAYQAGMVMKKQQEIEKRENSNYINLQQLTQMVYENQKTSERQFIAIMTVSILTLVITSVFNIISYIIKW